MYRSFYQRNDRHHKNMPFSDVNSEDFVEYINFRHRQTLSKNICRILFKMELDYSRMNLFNTWLIRKSPLLTVFLEQIFEHNTIKTLIILKYMTCVVHYLKNVKKREDKI